MEQNKTDIKDAYIRSLSSAIPFLVILAAGIALGISCGLIFDFDSVIGHFEYGSLWFYVMAGGIILSVIISAIFGIRAKRKFSMVTFPDSSPLSVFASYLAAIMALVLFAMYMYDIFYLQLELSNLEIAAAACLPAITISMILGCHEKTRQSIVRIIFALLAVVSVNLTIFACYFDFTMPMNSPVRHIITVAQAAVLLFLLSEARLAISASERAVSTFYVFTSAAAASAALGISAGLLIFHFSAQSDYGLQVSVYRFACYAAIGLLAFSRLISLKDAAGEYIEIQAEADEADELAEADEGEQSDKQPTND